MRVFALSDVHVDYPANRRWLEGLPPTEHREDVLILAGDLTDNLALLERCLSGLAAKFKKVLFVPGNHELWVIRDTLSCSIKKFELVAEIAAGCGVSMQPAHFGPLSVVPLFGWYDFSFGEPGARLRENWSDFYTCSWPDGYGVADVARYFAELNQDRLGIANETVISFSHFLPRIDVMPSYIPRRQRYLYPVLGGSLLGDQVKALAPAIHVYGHSHVQRQVVLEGVRYVNNAFGYPSETRIPNKDLLLIHQA